MQTPSTPLQKIVAWMDAELNVAGISDYPGALNGLQVENRGAVRNIAAAVDACESSIKEAVRTGAGLLIVHHGLFWSGAQSVTGAVYRKLRLAMENDLAIYSCHLPLDFHPKLGNNALLARALGWKKTAPFLTQQGQATGLQASLAIDRNVLHQRLEKAVGGRVHLCPGGPQRCRRIGLVTGGAGSEVAKAAAEGVDTYITGEGPHWSYTLAEELGINVFYAGHYATETFGVRALAEAASRKFRLPWEFIDHPTGL